MGWIMKIKYTRDFYTFSINKYTHSFGLEYLPSSAQSSSASSSSVSVDFDLPKFFSFFRLAAARRRAVGLNNYTVYYMIIYSDILSDNWTENVPSMMCNFSSSVVRSSASITSSANSHAKSTCISKTHSHYGTFVCSAEHVSITSFTNPLYVSVKLAF